MANTETRPTLKIQPRKLEESNYSAQCMVINGVPVDREPGCVMDMASTIGHRGNRSTSGFCFPLVKGSLLDEIEWSLAVHACLPPEERVQCANGRRVLTPGLFVAAGAQQTARRHACSH
ncbi:unnamed protein product [Tuber aestivum]|uniref:Uncharacterized protein n=1 Tax=Tuber aestivum TaxID=59557 RepID=A0A292PLU2_9PEZI|nr:unnamed protein product [Tuber aestivum]